MGWKEPGAAHPRACDLCGAVPAVRADLRRQIGMITLVRIRTSKAALCRECGVHLFGHFTVRTLLFGWWTVLLAPLNVMIVVLNFVSYLRFVRLPPGQGGDWGWLVRQQGFRRLGNRHPWGSVAAGVLCSGLLLALIGYAVALNIAAL
jgi:hypothetical protein